jgi:gliding motility-associated-like protein
VVIDAQPAAPATPIVGNIIQPTCVLSTGSVGLSGLPATGTWTINPGSIEGSGNTATISGLTAGIYNFTVTNASGCISPATGNVVINAPPEAITFSSETAADVSCNGFSDGSITIVVTGSTADYMYSIDNGVNYVDNDGVFTNLLAGSYQVRVRDLNNCEQAGSNLVINQPLPLLIDTTSVTHALGEVSGSILLVAEGGTSPYTFVLDRSNADSVTKVNGEFTDLIPSDYSAYAIDKNLCYSDTIDIIILQTSTKIKIYDAFSPNADGKNDVWNIYNISLYLKCSVTIINTWGSKVFTSNGYTTPWDGKYNDKDLPAGTYYYIIDLGDGSGVYSGPVSIVR